MVYPFFLSGIVRVSLLLSLPIMPLHSYQYGLRSTHVISIVEGMEWLRTEIPSHSGTVRSNWERRVGHFVAVDDAMSPNDPSRNVRKDSGCYAAIWTTLLCSEARARETDVRYYLAVVGVS